ncbi:glycosyltransferase [Candidatus Dependentiae bacterium]
MDRSRLDDAERLSRKKILLVSEFSQDASSPYTYATSFARSMRKLGCDVKRFNCKKSFLPYFTGSSRSFCRGIRQVNDALMNRELRRVFKQFLPDVVFLLKGENVSFRTLRWMKRRFECKLMNFYPDSPFVFWNANSNSNILLSLPYYDRFAIWSHILVKPLLSAGCVDVPYFPFGYDDELFFTGMELTKEERKKFDCQVSFVGSWDSCREESLLHLIEKIPSLNLAIWGIGWRENVSSKSILYEKIKGGVLNADIMARVLSCSKIVLNFLRRQNMTSHNMRTFEATACGSFLLAERSYEQAELLFKEGESVACFGDLEELVSKVLYYLENSSEREKIAKQGCKVAQHYSLDRFISKMLLGHRVWDSDILEKGKDSKFAQL